MSLVELLAQIARRDNTRSEATLQADIRQLVLTAPLSLSSEDVVTADLAWMPTEGKLSNKMTVCVRRHHCIHVLGFHFTPRSAEGLGSGYPKTRRNRLPPSQGMTRSVLSNPAATNNGLCARFWNFTTT